MNDRSKSASSIVNSIDSHSKPCDCGTNQYDPEALLGKRHETEQGRISEIGTMAMKLGFNTQESEHLHKLYVELATNPNSVKCADDKDDCGQ